MNVCSSCNTPLNENASFCPNCGKDVSSNFPAFRWNPSKEPISVGGWIGRMLIPYIPLVGGIVYLIMLFIWSGDSSKEETFRNWAKAQLIVMAIVMVLFIIGVILFFTVFAETLSYL